MSAPVSRTEGREMIRTVRADIRELRAGLRRIKASPERASAVFDELPVGRASVWKDSKNSEDRLRGRLREIAGAKMGRMFGEECDSRIARTASLGTAADLCALAFFPRFLIPEPRRVGSLKPRTLDEIKTGEKLVPTMSDTAPTNAEIRRMTRETISQLLGLEAMLTVLQAVAWVPGTGMVAAGIAIRASLLAVRNVEGLEADCVPNRMANNTWKRLQGTPQETNQ